jgi:hypothetical protein
MNKILSFLKNPLVWLAFLLTFFASYNNYRNGEFDHIVSSDGRGYYAYLPAIFIFNDNSYSKSVEAEKKYKGEDFNQAYLYKDKEGKTYNKYFPGVAIMQSPFFAMACVYSWISGNPIDGYSKYFQFSFFLGSLFYTLLGLFLFASCLRILFPNESQRIKWLIILLFAATPLLMYNTNTLGFTHHYTFCLFGLFTLQVLKLKSSMNAKSIFFLGMILGLITLVRPTNALVVLIIPFLLGDQESLLSFIRRLFNKRAINFISSVFGFFLIIFLLLLTWKWQSGNWFVWSYSGEGFNFLHPELYENLVGFRVGLLVQTPLLILSIIGAIILFKSDKFRAFTWWIYFSINAWVISSWWCWDYESTFGNRPFTEHLFFLVIPAFILLKRFPKIVISSFVLFALLGVVRYGEYISGYLPDHRFTKQNYFESMLFWKSENHDRWRYTQSTPPFGPRVEEFVLLDDHKTTHVTSNDEYCLSVQSPLNKPRTTERYYYSVELEKRLTEPLESVFLVIHAMNQDESKQMYSAVELLNDRQAGIDDWAKVKFTGLIPDNYQEFDFVKFYIWNKGRNTFEVRDMKIVLETYKT